MIFLYITAFLIVLLFSFGEKGTILNNKYSNNALLFLLFIIISISIYHVDLHSVPDLKNYLRRFDNLSVLNFHTLIDHIKITQEPMFDILQWLVAKSTSSFRLFVIIVWGIIFYNFYKAVRNLFDSNTVIFVMVSYFSFFIFFNYVLNVMRQGLAISFIFLAISLLITNKSRITFFISIIFAPMFHITSLPISLVLLYLSRFRLNLKLIVSFWLLSILLFLTNTNIKLFSNVQYNLLDIYTSERIYERYAAINRLDFLAFSVFFAIVFFVLKNRLKQNSYNTLLKLYLIFNSYFLLLGFIAFNDRIAAYSWMLIPVLLWKYVPNTVNERYKTILLTTAFVVSMLFTGSMNVIIESL